MDNVAKESPDLSDEKKKELKQLFPEVFSEGKIDFDKLKTVLGEEIDTRSEKYSFSWAGRKDAFKAIQTTAKGTLKPAKDESVDWDSTENLFIEGDNLEVLKLLQKSYFNKVKMIYIDPPYNTGNDFVYEDNFKDSIAGYLEQTGQKKDGVKMTTNPETNGRYHSDWLTMMYPRLYVARNLLRDDGVIFVSIDDHEVHNLRKIMEEIFGEENIDVMVWHKSGFGRYGKMKNTSTFRKDHEYVLVAFKNKQELNKTLAKPNFQNDYPNPDNDPRGSYKAGSISRTESASNPEHEKFYTVTSPSGKKFSRQFDIEKEEFERLDSDNRIYWGKNGDAVPAIKIFLDEKREVTTSSLLQNVGTTYEGTEELNELLNVEFANEIRPKPSSLIRRLVQIGTAQEDIVLDFFAGSGTTAQAVLGLNKEDGGSRQFICVQLPEAIEEDTDAYKQGYKNIANLCKERIKKAISQIVNRDIKDTKQTKLEQDKTDEKEVILDAGFKVFKLDKSNHRIWQEYEGESEEELKEQLKLFKTPLVSDYRETDVIYECIIKEGYSLNSQIEQTEVQTNKVYKVVDEENQFYITLDEEVDEETIIDLELGTEDLFICLDTALDDSKKKNLSLQCKLKVI